MAEVALSLNGRSYRFQCRDGEEAHLRELGQYFRQHVEKLTLSKGQIGDERLLLMAGLMITDELFEARKKGNGKRKAGATLAAALEKERAGGAKA